MGGTTFAHADAQWPDMPTHAIDTGHVDFVLSGEAIGLALSRLSALALEASRASQVEVGTTKRVRLTPSKN